MKASVLLAEVKCAKCGFVNRLYKPSEKDETRNIDAKGFQVIFDKKFEREFPITGYSITPRRPIIIYERD
jgi:hypothetical protein